MKSTKETFSKLADELKNNKVNDLVEETYNCNICKDTGYYTVEIFEEVYDSYIRVSKECKCLAKLQSEKYLENSGLLKLTLKTVNSYQANEKWQKAIKEKAIEYVKSDSREWFVMLGQSGSGKTHICSAIAKTLIEKGLRARYITWDDFTEEINTARFEENDRNAIRRFQTIDLLYIDDFLKGKISESDLEIAYRVLNYRYNNDFTTIISSEFTLSEIADIDSAIAGRIREKAKSYLLQIAKDKKKNFRFKDTEIIL